MPNIQKLQKSKLFISLLVALMLVFSFNQSKPKAFVPVAWAGYILASLAAEQLITMGVKAGSKAMLKKKADDYSAQALKNGQFDFMGTNPYRNKDGSITISPSANDRAKMAGLIGGSLAAMYLESQSGAESCLPEYSTSGKILPLFETSGATDADKLAAMQNAQKYVTWRYSLIDSTTNKYNIYLESKFTGAVISTFNTSLIDVTYPDKIEIKGHRTQEYGNYIWASLALSNGQTLTSAYLNAYYRDIVGVFPESETVAKGIDENILLCNGIAIPSTVEDIYEPPLDMSPDYKMPNDHLLVDIPITIYNVLPAGQEGEITWTDIEKYYEDNSLNFADVMDSNIDNYLENGNVINNKYTVGEIKNIYTDTGLMPKEEFQQEEIPTKPSVPVPIPPGGEIVPVDPIDRTMLQVMKESYQFLADGIDNSIQSMKTVTDKSMGLINYLDTAFRWLPAEWRAMFGAAFVLGVFAHFFRR